MSAYFTALIDIEDQTGYEEYLAGFDDVFDKFQGEVIAVEDGPRVLEGNWPARRTVLIRFPDETALMDWYRSPGYQAIREHRVRSARCSVAVLTGRD